MRSLQEQLLETENILATSNLNEEQTNKKVCKLENILAQRDSEIETLKYEYSYHHIVEIFLLYYFRLGMIALHFKKNVMSSKLKLIFRYKKAKENCLMESLVSIILWNRWIIFFQSWNVWLNVIGHVLHSGLFRLVINSQCPLLTVHFVRWHFNLPDILLLIYSAVKKILAWIT